VEIDVQYTRSGGVAIAYQVVGDGDTDLVFAAGWASNLVYGWEIPHLRTFGARVAARAGGGEVLVSQTVKDLVAGAGIEFDEGGEHELKGVPGEWRLYAVVDA
jgi:hypothetical protein